jgi:hypothetical protein
VLRPGGSLVKLKVDARDGTIIGRKAKGDLDGERARQNPTVAEKDGNAHPDC